MKRFISFLLVFVVLLSSFIVPVSAEDDYIIDDSFPEFEEPTTTTQSSSMLRTVKPEDVNSGKLRITHYIYRHDDTTGKQATFSSIGADTTESITYNNLSSAIDFTTNKNKIFYNYLRVKTKDSSILLSTGNDLKYEISNMYISNLIEYLNTQNVYPVSYVPTPTQLDVAVIDYSGATKYLTSDNCSYQIRKSVAPAGGSSAVQGGFDVIINIKNLDFDIVGITFKFTFSYNDMGVSQTYLNSSSYKHYFNYGMTNGVITFTESKSDKTSGLLSGIIEWIKSIWQGITELPSKIASSLKAFFDNVVGALREVWTKITESLSALGEFIIEGLKSLFIPTEGYFALLFQDLSDYFSQKLGVLTLPFEVVADIMNAYLNIGEGSGKLYWNAIPIKVKGKTYMFMKNGQIDFKSAFTEILGDYYNVYFAFIDCFLYFMLIRFAKRKYDSVIGSGAVSYESGSE